jgi:uncharacterized repeat protein (TIGR02543 family)
MNKKIFFCFWVLIAALIFAADTATAQRPYAELSTDGKTLTFKVGTGTGYALPEDGYSPAWLLSGATSTVEEVVFEDIITPVTCKEWFHDFTALTTIRNIDNLHTESVRDMSYMFAGCSNLTVIDIRNFDFSSVTNMDWMFGNCSNLTTILVKESQLNGDGLNIGNTVSHNNVFAYCYSLVGNTGTLYSRVDNAYYEALSAIDQLFDDRYSGGYLTVDNYKIFYDLSADDEIRLETVAGAPAEYEGGTEVSLPELDGSDELGQFKYWVRTSQNSTGNVVLGSSTMTVAAGETGNRIYSAKWTRSKEKYVYFESSNNTLYFRYDAQRPETNAYSLNVGSTTPSWLVHKDNIEKVVFETPQLTPATCYKWFAGCSKLTAVDITNIKTTVLTNTESMFDGCSSLTAILVDNDQWGYLPNYYVNKSDNMFRGCSSLIGERGSWIDDYVDKTSAFAEEGDNGGFFTKDGYKIFCDLNGGELNGDPYDITLEYNDDVELGTPTKNGMSFAGWVRATSFDDSNYECVYATDASTTVIIPKNSGNYQFKATWAVVKDYAYLSDDSKTLTFTHGAIPEDGNYFDLNTGETKPTWQTAGATVEKVVFASTITPNTCYYWFDGFENLTTIENLENLHTENVTDMRGMFMNCSGLTTLDLSSFNSAQVTDMNAMFRGCSSLKTIKVGSDWNTDAVTNSSNMFTGCSVLVGGKGTTFDADHTDKTYARIDGGPTSETPGYLSDGRVPYVEQIGTTLTFKYGVKPNTGTVYDLNTGTNMPAWATDANKQAVTTVVFDESFENAMPTSCFWWFAHFSKLSSIEHLEYLNTESVTDMKCMFYSCEGLSTINVSNFNTANVEDMGEMFGHCKITNLDVSNFNTASVKETYAMFYDCSNLINIDVSNFNTASVTKMREMFYGCSGLTTLDLSSFNSAQVTDMNAMFRGCNNLTTIKVSNEWTTSNVSDDENMFYGCSNLVGGNGTTYDADHTDKTYARIDGGSESATPGYLTAGNEPYVVYESNTLTFYYGVRPASTATRTIYALNTGQNIPQWIQDHAADISSVVFNASFQQARPTTCYSWFAGCTNLTEITGMKERLNTEKVEDMSKMFYNCQNLGRGTNYLAKINVANFKTDNVTSMDEMFSGCSNVTSLDLCSFSFSSGKLNSVKKMFAGCSNLQTILVSDNWVLPSAINATNSEDMFDGCSVLKGSSGTEYSTAGVKDATYAHADGGTSNPGYFSKGGYYAFYDNETLIFKFGDRSSDIISPSYNYTYDIPTDGSMPSWNTLTLRSAIHHIVFDKSFDGARPTNCKKWFQNFSNLESLSGMQYFHTDEVTDMSYMFHKCETLKGLDLRYFNTSHVTDMSYMFCACKKITVLNLETFNTSAVTAMNNMFVGMEELRAIYVDEWVISNTTTTTEMFGSNNKLVGGLGTTFVETNDNGTYAKIDGGTSSPGYFTNVNKYGYAVLNNGTLTFKKGRIPDNLQGTVFELVPFTEKRETSNGTFYYEHPAWQAHCGEINNVVFENGFQDVDVRTCHEWFQGCTNLTSITGLAHLNTSNVTDMSFMFSGCENLSSINLDGLNTQNVTNMRNMFYDCKSLTSINLSPFVTGNVRDFSLMFKDCENLGSIDITGFNTEKGTEFYSMFENCKKLETVNVSQMRFNSSDVRVGEMFMGCSGLTSINISMWATLKNFQNLFSGCSSLTNVTVGNLVVTETTEDIHGMFEGCSSLDDEAMANAIGGFTTTNVKSMANLFKGCTSLTVLDISHFNPGSITAMQHMFSDCPNLTTIKVEDSWSINADDMFDEDYEKMDIFYNDISLIGNDGTVCDVTKYPNFVDVDYAKADDGGLLTSGDYYKIFYDLDADDGEIKVEPVAGAVDVYAGNSEVSLPTLPDSDEFGPFKYWVRTSQDVSGNVVLGSSTMTIAANETGNRIYSAKWTLSKQKYVYYESSNNTLYFRFDANKPEGAYSLNEGSNAPEWLAHSNDIENVVFETTFEPSTCYHWFAGCSKLKALDLTKLDPTNVTDMRSMFYGCTNLTAILVDDNIWTYSYIYENVTESDNMFAGCTSLIGNNGGWIENDYLNKSFATVNDGYGNGYLTSGNFKIFYDLDDGELNGERYPDPQEYSADVELGIPTKEGYTFFGWARETSNGVFSDPSTTVTIPANPGNYKFKAMWAVPYAELSADEQTLTFKYGVKPDGAYDLNEGVYEPDWYTDGRYQNITKVKFDESFQNVRPTTCSKWFLAMSNLEEIEGLTNLNTSEVTCMGSMFTGCEKLTVLDLSSFSFSPTAESLKTNGMFEACTNLTTIIVGEGWDNTKITGTSENMFNGCSALIGNGGATVGTTIDKTFATAEEGGYLTKDSYKIFYKWADDVTGAYHQIYTPSTFTFSSTTSVNIDNPSTRADGAQFLYWTQVSASGEQIGGSSANLTIAAGDAGNRIYVMNWAVPYAELSADGKTLAFKYGAKPDGAYNLNTETNEPEWYSVRTNIETVVFESPITPTTCYEWFAGMSNLTSIINIENLHTENVKNMQWMFNACKKLTNLDLSTFNTENVEDMQRMFEGCTSLKTLNLSSFNTAKASAANVAINAAPFTEMHLMFYNCTALTTILVGDDWTFWSADLQGTFTDYPEMFTNCNEIIGNNGTTYNTERQDSKFNTLNNGLITKDSYKIFYKWADDVSGAYQAHTPSTFTFSSTTSVDIPEPTREGYQFLYWTQVSASGTQIGSSSANLTIAAGDAGNRIYVMNWTALHKINLPAGWTAYAADDLNTPITSAPAGTKIVVKYTGTKPIKKVEVFPQPTSITLTPSGSQTLLVRGTLDLTCTITPDDVLDEDKEITWRSGNTSVATVTSNGKVTAVAVGETTITAETVNHKTATITIIVE